MTDIFGMIQQNNSKKSVFHVLKSIAEISCVTVKQNKRLKFGIL